MFWHLKQAAALLAASSSTNTTSSEIKRSEDVAALREYDGNTPWPAVLGVFVAIVAFTWALLAMAL